MHTLLQSLSPKSRPSVGARFHIALCLARYYAKFVSVVHFHKGMHSHIILFFNDKSRPYLVGCAEARAEASPEYSSPLSDAITNRELFLPWNINLGMSESEPSRPTRWSAAADIYGLGVMLLEIGQWTGVGEVWQSASLYDFHQEILPGLVQELGYHMGDIYKSVAEFCLKMDTSRSTEIGVWE
ncbi:hypothetical protein BJX70DRAFT_363858 [Aspergillus crustosus]